VGEDELFFVAFGRILYTLTGLFDLLASLIHGLVDLLAGVLGRTFLLLASEQCRTHQQDRAHGFGERPHFVLPTSRPMTPPTTAQAPAPMASAINLKWSFFTMFPLGDELPD
jgi:hypothetical protein